MPIGPSSYFQSTPIAADRALLSRVADSLYWMSRYVERAEHIARVLRINTNLLMDVGDLEPETVERQWRSVMQIAAMRGDPPGTGNLGERVVRSLTLDSSNPTSLISCLSAARENARAIRSEISNEMWEQINSMYWSIRSDETRQRLIEQPEELFYWIALGSMTFQGLTDQTLDHDQRWMFAQLAKSLERIDMTCRIVEVRYDALQEDESMLDAPLRNIQWMAVLRMCCSIESFRRQVATDLDPLRVVAFLVLEDNFPRSVRFNVDQALKAMNGIRHATMPGSIDPAEKILGRLAATLTYANPTEIDSRGVNEYLHEILIESRAASTAVQQTYFLK